MDDALIKRWKDGDKMARVAVRNGVRGIAERVLGHPGLHRAIGLNSGSRLLEEDERREETAAIADEVLKRGAPGASQLAAVALITAGRRAVEELQSGRPVSEEQHTPPQALVTYALASQGMAPRVREAVERHLSVCAACRDDVRILGNILRTQEAVAETVDRDRVSEEFQREAREAAPDVGPDLAARLKEASQAATADVARETMERISAQQRQPRQATPRKASRGRYKVHRDRRPEPSRGALSVVLPVLGVVVVVGGIWWWSRGGPEAQALSTREVASLAVREAPRLRDPSGLPEQALLASQSLANGDCVTAAGRFKAAAREAPEARLYLLEGASWVCAGRGDRALEAFAALEALGEEPPRTLPWYRAQAWLLVGKDAEAIEDLTRAQLEDPKHRDQAAALTRAVQSLR